jgi:hypothetical protein
MVNTLAQHEVDGLKKTFGALDIDHDGNITVTELKQALLQAQRQHLVSSPNNTNGTNDAHKEVTTTSTINSTLAPPTATTPSLSMPTQSTKGINDIERAPSLGAPLLSLSASMDMSMLRLTSLLPSPSLLTSTSSSTTSTRSSISNEPSSTPLSSSSSSVPVSLTSLVHPVLPLPEIDVSLEEAQQIVDSVDIDGDGCISYDELILSYVHR